MRWEYRVRTVEQRDDQQDGLTLTNSAVPVAHEADRDGWEIFAVIPAGEKLRLFMKRPR